MLGRRAAPICALDFTCPGTRVPQWRLGSCSVATLRRARAPYSGEHAVRCPVAHEPLHVRAARRRYFSLGCAQLPSAADAPPRTRHHLDIIVRRCHLLPARYCCPSGGAAPQATRQTAGSAPPDLDPCCAPHAPDDVLQIAEAVARRSAEDGVAGRRVAQRVLDVVGAADG